ncbi:hypothetical protein OQA88_4349 [Cercophora sp. LCS_1]
MSSYIAAFLAAFPLLATASPAFDLRSQGDVNYTAIFAQGLSPGATLHFPSQPDYNTSVIQRWSTWAEPTFAVTIKPAVVADIQFIIKTANQYRLPFLATGGAHGGETGFANVKQAINIELSNFKEKKIDLAKNRLTVGPGISFVDFEEDLYNAGKFVPVGNAFCVNMIGATMGAGVGPYQGLHGLVIDALRSVRLVTATGDVVTASDSENDSLFWAIRGAGANFGIVVSATYEIFDAPNGGKLIEADFAYNGSVNGSMWKLLQTWDKTYPKEMGLTVVMTYSHATKQTALSASMTFFGPQKAAQPWIDQFLSLKPNRWQNQTIPWFNASQSAGFGSGANACVRGVYNSHPSVGTKVTAPDTYTNVFNQYFDITAARPWFNGAIVVQRFNTAATLALPKAKQGVYPGREIASLVVLENYYDGPQHDDEVLQFSKPLRDQLAATSGFGELRTYINYANGDESPEVWYGKGNLPRLSKLKKKWDPQNKFGAGNPIPISGY